MKVKTQKLRLPVKVFEHGGAGLNKKHSKLLPNNVRALCVGPSGIGKTAVILSLLFDKNGLKFKNVYLFSNSSDQPKYEFLGRVLKKVKGLGFYRVKNEFLRPEEVEEHSVCIFDDVIGEKQGPIQDFFSRGRQRSIDTFYLGQTYSRIPKQLIRDNSNFVIVFKMDDMNLKHVYSDHAAADMSFAAFHEMCENCWKDRHGFLVIDKESEAGEGRYRKGFDCYIKT